MMLRTAFKVVIVAVIGGLLLDTAVKMGAFKYFHHQHHPGACRKLNEKQKSFEDFFVTSGGIAFITSGFNFGPASSQLEEFYEKFNIKGKMMIFDFSKPKIGITELQVKSSKKFNMNSFKPHGIDVIEDKSPKKEHLLYVVNHPPNEADRVEKFQYLPKTKELLHVKSIFSDMFGTINDVAVVKEDVFYVTNYLVSTTPFWGHLEFFLPLGSVLFYDGSTTLKAAPYLYGPNGITLSRDGKFIYLNTPHEGKMAVYKRNPKNNTLTLGQSIDLQTSPDNLHLSQSGNSLFAACHPIAFKAMMQMRDPEHAKSPSQVVHIPLKDGLVVEDDITEVFYDHGSLISGSTIATIYNNLLLVGSMANNLILCDTNGPFKTSDVL